MRVNILKIPIALVYFLIGVVATYVSWEFVPVIIDVVNDIGLFDFSTIAPIMWFGLVTLSIIFTIGYPAWIILEKED